jgi:hypothetical protein
MLLCDLERKIQMNEQSHIPESHQVDPALLEEQMWRNLEFVRDNTHTHTEDLFGAKKMQSREYPERTGIRVALDNPLDIAVSSRSEVTQELQAIVGLGSRAAIGIVTARDKRGESASYVSLISANLNPEGRAISLGVLKQGEPFNIGRDLVQNASGREDLFSGVSGTHCTLEVKGNVLTVIDENSTNGTSVYTNNSNRPGHYLPDIRQWSQPSVESEKMLTDEVQARKIEHLGRFVAKQ